MFEYRDYTPGLDQSLNFKDVGNILGDIVQGAGEYGSAILNSKAGELKNTIQYNDAVVERIRVETAQKAEMRKQAMKLATTVVVGMLVIAVIVVFFKLRK